MQEWLNDCFATFAAYQGVGNSLPKLDVGDQFLLTTTEPALYFDSLPNSAAVADYNAATGNFDYVRGTTPPRTAHTH